MTEQPEPAPQPTPDDVPRQCPMCFGWFFLSDNHRHPDPRRTPPQPRRP